MRGEHLMVTLDPVGNDGEAGAPRLPVVAAAELSGDDEAEGLDEGVNVRIRCDASPEWRADARGRP